MEYIALDLETTGFDAEKDQVIEIAAIKFSGDEIIETFDTLINPGIKIPPMITHITGIKDEDLINAAKFEEVQGKLKYFLGDLPIIGHNISFDIKFLNQKGLNIQNPLYDTLQLASILIPGLPSYSLGTLTLLLKITHEAKHRALSDTIACQKLFLMLKEKIADIDANILAKIKEILGKSSWSLKEIFINESGKTVKEIAKPEKIEPPPEIVIDNDEITAKILEKFKSAQNLIVETGAGHSLFYLSAVKSWSPKNNIIISTHNRNLREKLLKKLPNSVPLRNRENYLSLYRLNKFIEKRSFEDFEVTLIIKILIWLKKTKTGDFREIAIQGKEYTSLNEVCCNDYECQHDKGCFAHTAQEQATHANVVIVDHSLLIKDLIAENPILPEYEYLIADEAHHLVRVTTDSSTLTLSISSLLKPLDKPENNQDVQQLISKIEIFFGLMGIYMEKNLSPSEFQYQLNITPQNTNNLEWQKVKGSAASIINLGNELLQKIPAKNAKELKNKLDEIKEIFAENLKTRVSWLFKAPDAGVFLKSAPLNVGHFLKSTLYKNKKSVIITSPTLTVNKSFNFIREQLGLEEKFEDLILPAKYDNPEQIKVFLTQNLPPPATEGHFIACANLISDIIRHNQGQTLILFTSKRALTATYMQIAPTLKAEGFNILGQSVTGGRGKILEQFKVEPKKSAILATENFWESVNIPGNLINCVIIQKLPFDPPYNPIIQARSQKYTNGFNEYQLPLAILKFKQGFNRLFKDNDNTGSMIILDTRISQKAYGKEFLQSLPEGITIEHTSKEQFSFPKS